jgi:hypothetical protein
MSSKACRPHRESALLVGCEPWRNCTEGWYFDGAEMSGDGVAGGIAGGGA